MNFKKMIFNKSVIKRAKYFYAPLFLIVTISLFIASYFTTKRDVNFLHLESFTKGKISIVYNDYYNITFGGLEKLHHFDTEKYKNVKDKLVENLRIKEEDFLQAGMLPNDLLQMGHSQEYIKSIQSSWTLARITELTFLRFFPSKLSRNLILFPMKYQASGSILASTAALERGWSINLGGGFHHASYGNGEGFCVLADISMVAKYLRQNHKIKKIMIIDLDAHQGNGHGKDFIGDENTYILDVYNKEIYPNDVKAKKGIDLKIELFAFTSDKVFLDTVSVALDKAFNEFKPDFVIYIAGTDILEGDPLGAMSISRDGVIKRDEMVFAKAFEYEVPITMLLGGGYQKNNAEVIASSIINLDNKFQLINKD